MDNANIEKEFSVFKFNLNPNTDVQVMNNVIYNYLQSEFFVLKNRHGDYYFKAGSSLTGYRYFSYEVVDGNLLIYASVFYYGRRRPIENKNIIPAKMFRNTLPSLFNNLKLKGVIIDSNGEKTNQFSNYVINGNDLMKGYVNPKLGLIGFGRFFAKLLNVFSIILVVSIVLFLLVGLFL